jgi:hypothetical protein
MKRPINQTLIIHSAQLAPGWSTGAAKYDYSLKRNGKLSRDQSDNSSGVRHAI